MTPILNEALAAAAPHRAAGKVADYIPALARVDPDKLGIAFAGADGVVHGAGDCDEPFSIQSISKVFTLALALEKVGVGLWERVGREPSGSAFNSIVQLESEKGIPRNPLINPGAIVVTDALIGEGGWPTRRSRRCSPCCARRRATPASRSTRRWRRPRARPARATAASPGS